MSSTTAVRSRDKHPIVPSLPYTMKAAAIDRFGGPKVLKMHDLPIHPWMTMKC